MNLVIRILCLLCIMNAWSQVGIGNTNPDASSILDITATDKGVLIPRVSLVNVTDATAPINAPTTSLMVYNTNAAVVGGNGIGYYYWNSSQWQSFISVGDIEDVVAGDGLIGGSTSGTATLNVVAINGLTDTADDIRLGGTLIQNTTINQGNFEMSFELDGTGDFKINDSGITHFEVRDTGITYFGDDTYWNDGSTSGTAIARLYDIGDDGIFNIYSNGAIQHSFNTIGTSVFNEQGTSVDFRVESNTNAAMFVVDGSANRVGIGTSFPVAELHVNGGRVEFTGATDASGVTGTGVLEIANSLRLDGNEIITNTNGTLFLQHLNNGNLRVDNTTLFVDGTNNRVGIGTITPTRTLDVNGSARVSGNILYGSLTAISDRRLKENLENITSATNRLKQITGYSYNIIDDENKKREYGVMAQDLQKVFPEMVSVIDKENGYLGVSYIQLIPVLLEGIKEQQEEIDTLKSQLTKQQQEIDEIKALLRRQ